MLKSLSMGLTDPCSVFFLDYKLRDSFEVCVIVLHLCIDT